MLSGDGKDIFEVRTDLSDAVCGYIEVCKAGGSWYRCVGLVSSSNGVYPLYLTHHTARETSIEKF